MASILAEQSFRSLIENVQDMLVVLTEDGRFMWQSPSTQRVLGYAPEELLGRSAMEFIHPEDLPHALDLLDHTVATPHAVGRLVYRVKHRDGGWRVMEATGKNLLHDAAVAGLVLSARDVSERVRVAEELEAARAAAEKANRAKTEFLSRVSHELRTPLHAILGFAQLLEMELQDRQNLESVGHITRAGRHLLHLINEVLEISRIEEGRLTLSIEPVSLEEAVRQAVDLVDPLAKAAGVRVHHPPARGLRLLVDLQRLRQVLLNLLSNAVKYNHRGGEVELRFVTRAEDRLRIEVRDTGIGIAPEKQAAIFTPFERLGVEARGIEGTGLGLAVSRRLVEQMRGSIGLRSQPGYGSTFWVELPLCHSEEQAEPVESSRRGPAIEPPPSASVLQIEDNPANVKLLERLLSRWPVLRLFSAGDGAGGLEMAESLRPDLLILDLHLPDMHGVEILSRIRRHPDLHEIPVIVITADAGAERIPELAALAPRAVISKPFDLEVVATTVAAALRERKVEVLA